VWAEEVVMVETLAFVLLVGLMLVPMLNVPVGAVTGAILVGPVGAVVGLVTGYCLSVVITKCDFLARRFDGVGLGAALRRSKLEQWDRPGPPHGRGNATLRADKSAFALSTFSFLLSWRPSDNRFAGHWCGRRSFVLRPDRVDATDVDALMCAKFHHGVDSFMLHPSLRKCSLASGGTDMKCAAIPASLAAMALASMTVLVRGQLLDPFAEACQLIETGFQKDLNVCVIGVAGKDSKVRIVYATNAAMTGQVVAVFQSSIVQGALVPLEELSANEGKLVAIGGVHNADSIFSAKFLEVAGPWFAAAIEALAK
jgi:hypothetical protein